MLVLRNIYFNITSHSRVRERLLEVLAKLKCGHLPFMCVLGKENCYTASYSGQML